MKLIVGIGNPGKKYKNTRHNVGFIVLDTLVSQISNEFQKSDAGWKESKKGRLQYIWFELKEEKIELIKPQIFMNESGKPVAYAHKKHSELELDDFYVVHDDLDIKLGSYKITRGRGPRKHNGLLSIYDNLGTKDFWHVRIGVDNRSSDNRIPGQAYVLRNFTEEETVIIGKVINEVCGELLSRLKD